MTQRYLSLGSGQRPFAPPWTNWDIQEEKWRQLTLDAGCLWLDGGDWQHNLWDIICLHHVLEHFGTAESDQLMEACRHSLCAGGSLIITVPNLRALAQRWLTRQLTTDLFLINLYGAYMGDEADRHKQGFDRETLLTYLRRFFPTVKDFDWRRIANDSIARDWWILGVEAVK